MICGTCAADAVEMPNGLVVARRHVSHVQIMRERILEIGRDNRLADIVDVLEGVGEPLQEPAAGAGRESRVHLHARAAVGDEAAANLFGAAAPDDHHVPTRARRKLGRGLRVGQVCDGDDTCFGGGSARADPTSENVASQTRKLMLGARLLVGDEEPAPVPDCRGRAGEQPVDRLPHELLEGRGGCMGGGVHVQARGEAPRGALTTAATGSLATTGPQCSS